MKKRSTNSMGSPRRQRTGLTLVEMMVAIVVTLILAVALVRVFKIVGDEVNRGRATLELSGQLRTISHRLQADIDMLSAPVRPWPSPSSGLGYFEYGEGMGDPTASPVTPFGVGIPHSSLGVANTITGDVDDYIAFTAYSEEEPFVGQIFDPSINAVRTISSNSAEIIWWVSVDPAAPPTSSFRYRIHRRVLLIRPDLNNATTGLWRTFGAPANLTAVQTGMADFLNQNDLSARYETFTDASGTVTYGVAANSLADLSRREYRFGRSGTQVTGANVIDQTQFPFYPNVAPYFPASALTREQQGDQLGEDLMLKNVLAMDVKLFDPDAVIFGYDQDTTDPNNRIEPLTPGDPGYGSNLVVGNASNVPIGTGAFVDLHYGSTLLYFGVTIPTPSLFSGPPHTKSQLRGIAPAFDTWSFYYEQDGVDQDGSGSADAATNGFDDDLTAGIDDVGERDTSPPYPFSLRGVQVKVRAIEPSNRVVRQMTVTAEFVPE